jgi:hypothetical protein
MFLRSSPAAVETTRAVLNDQPVVSYGCLPFKTRAGPLVGHVAKSSCKTKSPSPRFTRSLGNELSAAV